VQAPRSLRCVAAAALIGCLAAGILISGCGRGADPEGPPTEPSPTVSASPSILAAASAPAAQGSAEPQAPAAPEAEPAAKKPVRVAFVGDIAMTGMVAHYLERRAAGKKTPAGVDEHYPFTGVRDRLAEADLAVGNLECVVSKIGAKATWHNPFRAPLLSIPVILGSGIDLVGVANNHTLDFGYNAFHDMLHNLDEGGLPYAGKEAFQPGPQPAVVRTIRGIRVGLLAYADVPAARAYADVKAARPAADVLIVFNHWGLEGTAEPILQQRRFGRGLIDAGADMVVGTHAHVLQPEEWYRGKLIAYGLGNFVFSEMLYPEQARIGAMLEVELDRTGVIERRLMRTRVDDLGAPWFIDDPAKAAAVKPPKEE
jgi:poly-gamma-glutamate capsule biosynthesis protein CapA/YwtB (metallophosphatase superfamily)